MTDKHDTKYNTLINEQPYIHARWLIFTFPGQNEPRPGYGTPWVNSGTIPAIPGRLATLTADFRHATAVRMRTSRNGGGPNFSEFRTPVMYSTGIQ